MSDANAAADVAANDELVTQFMAFTGSADPARAASYLEMSGGDLQTAVGLYMEHGAGDSTVSGGGGGGGAAWLGGGLGGDMMDVRAPDATRTMRLMDDSHHHPSLHHHMGAGMGGMMMMGGMMPGVHPAAAGMAGMDPSLQLMNAMMEEQLAQSAFASPPVDARAAVNSAAAASSSESKQQDMGDDEHDENYIYDEDEHQHDDDDDDDVQIMSGGAPAPPRLSDMFAAPTHLMHKVGGFQGARASAKDSKRWLLVNIQRDAEFASHALNRDVWRDELVENLIREGFIFWQQMDVTPEGRTYTERYQVRDYPHIGIIDPRTGRLMWRKEGWTQERPFTAETFAEMAMDFCSRNSFDRPPQAPRPGGGTGTAASTANNNNKRPMHDMTEDEQLEAAMRASMEDTSTKAMQESDDDDDDVQVVGAFGAQEDDDSKPAAAQQPQQQVEEEEAKPPSMNDELLAILVPDEPDNGARLQLKMPDGKRFVRRFAGSDAVRMVYAFVAQNNDEARGGREFALMIGFPPNDLINDIDVSIDDCKLSGQAIQIHWK